MSRTSYRHRPLEASLRLHTHRQPRGASALCSSVVSPRTSVRCCTAAATVPSVRCQCKAATGARPALRIRGVTVQETAPCPESSVRFASPGMPLRIGVATSAPLVRPPHSGMALAITAAPVSVPPHHDSVMTADLAVCLQPSWMPSLVAAAPVPEPLRRGGVRDGALAVCQRHCKSGLLLADTSDPVGVSRSSRRSACQWPGGHRARSA
jgi:hypothetical protein